MRRAQRISGWRRKLCELKVPKKVRQATDEWDRYFGDLVGENRESSKDIGAANFTI